MQAELVRAARHGVQLQQGGLPGRFQHAVARERLLPARVHDADQTAAADLIDRQVDLACVLRRMAKDGSQIGLFELLFPQQAAEAVVHVRVFCQQDHAEGIAVEPGHGVDARARGALLQVIQDAVGQRSAVLLRRGMDEHPGGLVHGEKIRIFIEDRKGHRFGIKALGLLLEHNAHAVAGLHRAVGMGGRSVYEQRVLPFEPLDQPRRQSEFPPQQRQQLRLPRSRLFQDHLPHLPLRLLYRLPHAGASAARLSPPAAGRNGPRSA